MDLQTYLTRVEQASKLSRRVGEPPAVVSQWKTRARPVPIQKCCSIEAATEFLVMRWDLRPDDWHLIWPELVDHPDAPNTKDGVNN